MAQAPSSFLFDPLALFLFRQVGSQLRTKQTPPKRDVIGLWLCWGDTQSTTQLSMSIDDPDGCGANNRFTNRRRDFFLRSSSTSTHSFGDSEEGVIGTLS
jgi:hypothetical protein